MAKEGTEKDKKDDKKKEDKKGKDEKGKDDKKGKEDVKGKDDQDVKHKEHHHHHKKPRKPYEEIGAIFNGNEVSVSRSCCSSCWFGG